MGKKALIRELEAALSQTLSDRAIERQRHAMVVNAMTAGMKRLTEERDEAEKNVAELLRNNETADSVIRDLRRECSAHSLNLLDRLAATQRERDAALGNWQNAEDLLIARERELDELQEQHAEMSDARDDLLKSLVRANTLIGNIRLERDGLHGRCAALSDELDELRAHSTKTIGDLRYQLQSSQAPVICSRCGRDVLAKDDAAPAEPVAVNAVTLQKIDALDIGERLIDDEGIIIEREHVGYSVHRKLGSPYLLRDPRATLRCYQDVKRLTM